MLPTQFLQLVLSARCLPKSQIPSTKLQINLKFQYSMTQTYIGILFS